MTFSNASKSTRTGKRFPVRNRASQYTFPQEDTIHRLHFDADRIHIHLDDGRIVSIPLLWIPSLFDAAPEDREKYTISDDKQLVIWDPEECAINEILRLSDYLQARPRHRTP